MPRPFFAPTFGWLVAAALSIAALFVLGWWFTAPPAEGYIANNIFVGQIPLGGLTVSEAEQVLQKRLDEIDSSGWTFDFRSESVTIKPMGSPTDDPDVAPILANVDIAATIQKVYAVGRIWNLNFKKPSINVPATVNIYENEIVEALKTNFPELEKPATNPTFAFNENNNELIILPEAMGWHFNQKSAISDLRNYLERLEVPRLSLSAVNEKPAVTLEEATRLLPKAQNVLTKLPLVLKYDGQNWEIKQAELLPYLTVAKNGEQLSLALRREFKGAILESIAREINRPLSSGRFKMEDGRVTLWQPPLAGRELDIEESFRPIERSLNGDIPEPVELVVKIEPAPALDGEGRDLGIREIIGVGKSNFKGSPKNRRHNIKVGADILNGILIPPGEEFSLVKALGTIDASTGYLQELVIKGNRTIPEFGGGLCQIGTTTFRAALASGLPILERQNHSYRVRYYEPAGTDATIYNPKPDFRFLNDTGNSILIQTKIQGDDLIFEFWGTMDGRRVSQTKPKIYNIVKPAAKKIIPTLDLPEGKEKCTEKAHDGADTEFTYTVIYPDGAKKERVFKSHYRSWQEVCLLGVKELPATADGDAPPENSNSGTPGADSPAAVTP